MEQLICTRISDWNKLRFPRIYNHELFISMLYEEFDEYTNAITMIDKLDGLADMYFISIGALWKLKVNPYKYLYRHLFTFRNEVFDITPKIQNEALKNVINTIAATNDDDKMKYHIAVLTGLIIKEFLYIGCTKKQLQHAISIICDSNDTKDVIKLKEDEKGKLKGENFISPFKQLNLLVKEVKNNG